MADKELTGLDPTITPAATDIFGVRQSGDSEDKRQTRQQVHNLQTGEHLILATVDEAATPTLAFGDGDSGFWESADDNLRCGINGSAILFFNSSFLSGSASGSFALRHSQPATGTVPSLIPDGNDADTGIGQPFTDQLSLIAGSVEMMRLVEIVGAEQVLIGLAIQNAPATPTLAFGDGDSGFYENADDFISVAIAGVREFAWGAGSNGFGGVTSGAGRILNEASTAINPTLIPFNTTVATGIGGVSGEVAIIIGSASQQTVGADGKLFVNTLTGTGPIGSIVSATPGLVSMFGAGTATNSIDGGAVEIWGGYAAGVSGSPQGGRVGIWGGGGGGGEAIGGNVEVFGGSADLIPGAVLIAGGVANTSGAGGLVSMIGGAGVSQSGGLARVIGGAGDGTGGGGLVIITGGASGAGATGSGARAVISGGASLATAGDGGRVDIDGGDGNGVTGDGGEIRITGGEAGGGATTGVGGNVVIAGGINNGGGDGSSVSITGGLATGTSVGGAVSMQGSAGGGAANGGVASITAGDSGGGATGDGGAVTVEAGASLATNGNGGDVNIITGAGAGSGVAGLINFTGEVGTDLVWNDTARPAILNEGATQANPNIIPNAADDNTGIGWRAADTLVLIAGGDPALEITRASAENQVNFTVEGFITANAGGGQGSAFILHSSMSNVTTVGTAGDSVQLASVFKRGTMAFVANSAAANAMDVFPASGDDLGAGTDTAISVAAGDAVLFFATVANATWRQIKG